MLTHCANIIALLQGDGRLPNTAIARRLGVAEATVRKRIDRLVRDEVIQFGAWADPLKVGYQYYAIIEIQVRLADIERAARRLAALPEIFFLGTCTGSCDVFAVGLFRSNDHLHEFMTKRLARVPGIQRTTTSSLTRIVKRGFALPVVGGYVVRDGTARPVSTAEPES